MAKRSAPTALVTGVSGGIGRGIVRTFAQAGWRVCGIALEEPDTDLNLDVFELADFRDPSAIQRAVNAVAQSEVTALVNNAGVSDSSTLEATSIQVWDEVMAVNARGALVALQEVLPYLTENGAVVNIASVHALATSQQVHAYAASKGALVAWTRAAALELAPRGIRVNAVIPGAIDTPMLRAGMERQREVLQLDNPDQALRGLTERTPLGRVGTPQEIGEAVLFLSDHERSGFITGQTIVVDGGVLARLSSE